MPRHPGVRDGVNLTVSLCLTYIICISCVRIWIRKGAYGSDDVVIAIATVLSFAHTAADYLALAFGVGTPWEQILRNSRVQVLNESSIAGGVLFTVTLYLSKCATLTFLSRITKAKRQVMLYHTINGIIASIGIVSLLLVTVACPSKSYYWNFYENEKFLSCPSQSVRWQVFTGLDVVTEMLLLALPVQLVWGLQMASLKKAMIVTAFSLRLPVIVFTILRNYFTLQLRLPQTDPGIASGLVVIWLEIQLAYALASSTLSASKAFTESFNSGFGLGFTRSAGEDSYGLSDISGKSGASKDEKSRGASTIGSTTASTTLTPSRSRADPRDQREDSLTFPRPLPQPPPPPSERPLKLRPGHEGRTFTSVTADPNINDHGPYTAESASSSNYSANDIHAQTEVEIHRDDAPILRA